MNNQTFFAKGSFWKRVLSVIFLFPAWFSPHSRLRVFFHRLRGIRIGKNVEIGYYCVIGNVHPNMITLKDGAVVAAGAVLLEHDNSYFYAQGGSVNFGPVVVGEKAFIGIHTVVLPNLTIGARAIVGANSLVTRNIPKEAVACGVPAKILGLSNGSNENS